jgi:hypothetical protein
LYINFISCYVAEIYNQHHTKWGKTETISSKVRNETKAYSLPTLIQYGTGIPSQSNKAKERNKQIRVRKEEVK